MDDFGKLWNSGDEPDEDFTPPDGNYDVEVIDASAFRSRSDDKPYAKLILQIGSGSNQGRAFEHFMNFNNKVGLKQARESLAMYGLGTEEAQSWPRFTAALPDLIGVRANVSVSRNSNGYQVVTVNMAQPSLARAEAAVPARASVRAPGVEDDIPFKCETIALGFEPWHAHANR